jgi:hypothetical protein
MSIEDQNRLRNLRITDPREDKARIMWGKGGLLRDSYRWVLDNVDFQRWMFHGEARLLWIVGDPGTGKTMLLCGISDVLSRIAAASNTHSAHLAYFFCQSTLPELNNGASVLRGLMYMLVAQRPQLVQHVRKRYEVMGKPLSEGPNAIYVLREMLSDMLNDTSISTTYLLVDALDECTSGLSELLQIITDASLGRQSRVKWLVTSRSTPEIERYLQPDALGVKVSLEVKASHVSRAVAAFIEHKVQQLATLQRYDPRLQAEVQQQLRDKAEGTFLWVSLVCKELEQVPLYRTREVLQAVPPGIDLLYGQMMAQIVTQDTRTVGYCRSILRAITLAFRPLNARELTIAAGLPHDLFNSVQAVIDLVSCCGSFLTVLEGVVSFIHLSAKDYFTVGSGQQVFDGLLAEAHGRITHRLLDVMDSRLYRDMCRLQKSSVRIREATGYVPGSCLPQMAYACEYWVEHLQAGGHVCSDMLADGGKVRSFFGKHFLHWLEAMSLLQKIPEAILALQKLEATLNVSYKVKQQVCFH